MASMLVATGPGHSATGADGQLLQGSSDWNIGGAHYRCWDPAPVLSRDGGETATCRHLLQCHHHQQQQQGFIAFISLKQGAGVQSPAQEGGLVTSNCRYDVHRVDIYIYLYCHTGLVPHYCSTATGFNR